MASETLRLLVQGMTCESCSEAVKQALEQDEGVSEARVLWYADYAEVDFDPERTGAERILENRVFRHQYSAEPWLLPGCC